MSACPHCAGVGVLEATDMFCGHSGLGPLGALAVIHATGPPSSGGSSPAGAGFAMRARASTQ
jgi:hypothetical protein